MGCAPHIGEIEDQEHVEAGEVYLTFNMARGLTDDTDHNGLAGEAINPVQSEVLIFVLWVTCQTCETTRHIKFYL